MYSRINSLLGRIFWGIANKIFSHRTIEMMKFDIQRIKTRMNKRNNRKIVLMTKKLHLGCGKKHVNGWLNIDLAGSDFDVDLAHGQLPWPKDTFEIVVSQHLIEHLDLKTELLPLLCEVHRVLIPDGEIWLSCPDIEKICRSYLEHNMNDLVEDRVRRFPKFSLDGVPSSHMINLIFCQGIQHKNLFDYKLLKWMLTRSGFKNVEKVKEADLLKRCPAFPPRNDDLQSIYVRAFADKGITESIQNDKKL